jgi:hypothetical protein
MSGLFSACVASLGVLMVGQTLQEEIPDGRIEYFNPPAKTGPSLHLDNGRDVVFFGQVLSMQPHYIQLIVGDRVEKRQDSFIYLLNGKQIANGSWVFWNYVFPIELRVLLTVHVLSGLVLAIWYGRTPVELVIDRKSLPKRLQPQTMSGRLIALFATWVAAVGVVAMAFAVMEGCLFGVGHAIRG